MASYWFLCPPVCDVVSMSVEADVEGVLCLPNVLLSALPAFDHDVIKAKSHGTVTRRFDLTVFIKCVRSVCMHTSFI